MSMASDDDSDDSAYEASKPRATDKANKATWNGARRVRAAIAHESALAMWQ